MPTSQEMLDTYLAAEAAVLRGQTVRLGERWVSLPDLQWIQQGRRHWEQRVSQEATRTAGPWYVINSRWSSDGSDV